MNLDSASHSLGCGLEKTRMSVRSVVSRTAASAIQTTAIKPMYWQAASAVANAERATPCDGSPPTERPKTNAATSASRNTGLRLPIRHSTRVRANIGATGLAAALLVAIDTLAHQPDVRVL